MRKMLLIVLVATVAVLMFSGSAFAQNFYSDGFTKTHYGFTTAAEGCAGCHVTHTATVAKLLKFGATQTDFCYYCHDNITSSPYDVESGRTLGNDPDGAGPGVPGVSASTAGFFGISGSSYYGGGGTMTSRHAVENRTTPGAALANTAIPGNSTSNGFTGGFKCGSCHDPHAGDKANDRLLKSYIWEGQTALATTVDFVYNGTSLIVSDYAPTASARDAINGYCALCHGKFNVGDNGAKTLNNTKYRHAIGVQVAKNTTQLPLGNKDNANDAVDKNQLLCLTCHYAHGTNKAALSAAYNSWSTDEGTFSGSVLLRLDKRGVCYDCHGAAEKNLEAMNGATQQTNN